MNELRNCFLIVPLILSLMTSRSYAEDVSSGLELSKELAKTQTGHGNEFVSGDYPGAILMKINLWGAIGKSGIHYVPAQTDLITLLSFAGGPSESANLDEVFIKRWSSGKERLILVDLSELIKNTNKESPVLEANDIVVVPARKPLISNDVASAVGIISSVLSIFAVGLVLFKK